MKLLLVLAAVFCATAIASPQLGINPGFQNNERVVGGAGAARNQFPYQASMQWGILGIFQHICGASIINSRSLLTAAHCITETPNIGSFRVRVGILLLNENVNTLQTVAVQSSVLHPSYAGGVNPHDIAVLRLSSALSFNEAVTPIALPVAGSSPTGNVVLSGWGAINGAGNSMPNQLQFVQKPVITLTECANALTSILGSSSPLDPTNVCTGPLTGGVSACSGDSGGPLAQNGVVVGVVSWGIFPCGTVGAPSVYVGVSNYIPWINANLI